jgi:hypothetical protein
VGELKIPYYYYFFFFLDVGKYVIEKPAKIRPEQQQKQQRPRQLEKSVVCALFDSLKNVFYFVLFSFLVLRKFCV